MQIKTPLRFYLIEVGMTIKNTKSNKYWQRPGKKKPWRSIWRSLRKLEIELPYDLLYLVTPWCISEGIKVSLL